MRYLFLFCFLVIVSKTYSQTSDSPINSWPSWSKDIGGLIWKDFSSNQLIDTMLNSTGYSCKNKAISYEFYIEAVFEPNDSIIIYCESDSSLLSNSLMSTPMKTPMNAQMKTQKKIKYLLDYISKNNKFPSLNLHFNYVFYLYDDKKRVLYVKYRVDIKDNKNELVSKKIDFF